MSTTMNAPLTTYTNDQLAKLFHVKVGTIQAWIKSGKLPPPDLRMGHRLLWSSDCIESVMAKAKTSQGGAA